MEMGIYNMTNKDEKLIISLYFEKMYSWEDLDTHFNNNYQLYEIRRVIDNYLYLLGEFNEK